LCFPLAGFLLDIFFYPEDGVSIFLCNAGELISDNMPLQPTKMAFFKLIAFREYI
jgi:hypothetical protein